tara:strand:+ start:2195 stop:2884 length:690 start_codon:yes stop_codon:yes gene_type:complete
MALPASTLGLAFSPPDNTSPLSLLMTWSVGPNAIGWAGMPHDPRWCITPPPFGKQCTLLRSVAMLACLRMPGCIALTCPDPAESHIGRKPGVTGPICQARRVRTENERGHGMCKPGGCVNFIVRRNEIHGARRAVLLDSLNTTQPAAMRSLTATPSAGLLLVQPEPPQWVIDSLASSVSTPPVEVQVRGTSCEAPPCRYARQRGTGTVFTFAELDARVGDGRRGNRPEL